MLFSELSILFSELESTSSRLAKIDLLSQLLKKGADDVDRIIYLSEGRVVPFFVPLEFNIGNALVQKSIAHAASMSQEEIVTLYSQQGDLGNVVYGLKNQKKGMKYKNFSVHEVFDALSELAHTTGKDSTAK